MIKDATFHHVGIASEDMTKTSEQYLAAGYNMSAVIYDKVQQTNISFLYKEGSPLLELVEPEGDISPVRNIINKGGVTPYHFCYEVANLDDSIDQLRQKKYVLLVKPVEAIAFDGRKICFLFHKDIGLIELLENEDSNG